MPKNQEPENRHINMGSGNYNESIGGDYIEGNVFQNIFNTFVETKPATSDCSSDLEKLQKESDYVLND